MNFIVGKESNKKISKVKQMVKFVTNIYKIYKIGIFILKKIECKMKFETIYDLDKMNNQRNTFK